MSRHITAGRDAMERLALFPRSTSGALHSAGMRLEGMVAAASSRSDTFNKVSTSDDAKRCMPDSYR
jgi:hypothetical protein